MSLTQHSEMSLDQRRAELNAMALEMSLVWLRDTQAKLACAVSLGWFKTTGRGQIILEKVLEHLTHATRSVGCINHYECHIWAEAIYHCVKTEGEILPRNDDEAEFLEALHVGLEEIWLQIDASLPGNFPPPEIAEIAGMKRAQLRLVTA